MDSGKERLHMYIEAYWTTKCLIMSIAMSVLPLGDRKRDTSLYVCNKKETW